MNHDDSMTVKPKCDKEQEVNEKVQKKIEAFAVKDVHACARVRAPFLRASIYRRDRVQHIYLLT